MKAAVTNEAPFEMAHGPVIEFYENAYVLIERYELATRLESDQSQRLLAHTRLN